jgi:effector-binding domain-containing protein
MKKKLVLLSFIVLLIALCFVPVSIEKPVLIKSSFLNIFHYLNNAKGWEKWRPDLKKDFSTDSNKILTKQYPGFFTIGYADLYLNIKSIGNSFKIIERSNDKNINYSFNIFPDSSLKKTVIVVEKNVSLFTYLLGKLRSDHFEDTQITNLKNFLEIDSLYYGAKIFKTGVPGTDLLMITKVVVTKNQFGEAAKMLTRLKEFIKINNVKQVRPIIAQFLKMRKDSTEVKVGLFVDKAVKSYNDIIFAHMPERGVFYVANFNGAFNKREYIYNGLKQYFADHTYQQALIPFETYLDDKLPVSDTDKVKIQVNFPSYF